MIKTTVARIFSPHHVALAAGTEQGVKEGMIFVIYALGETITDPETRESLGQLEIVKGRVRVFFIQEKLCQAETLTRTVTEIFDPLAGIRSGGIAEILQKGEITRTVPDELKVENPQPMSIDLTVRVGDFARSVD
jgi:hypothetical protein